jgi:hypothetical protein
MSVVSFVVAGVAAGGTIVYYFVDTGGRKEKVEQTTRPKTAVVPLVSPQFSGVSLVGNF